MLIRIFSPTECGLIRDADLKKCGLNRMTTVHSTILPILRETFANSYMKLVGPFWDLEWR